MDFSYQHVRIQPFISGLQFPILNVVARGGVTRSPFRKDGGGLRLRFVLQTATFASVEISEFSDSESTSPQREKFTVETGEFMNFLFFWVGFSRLLK